MIGLATDDGAGLRHAARRHHHAPDPASERLHARVGFDRCGTYHRAGWKHGAWPDVGNGALHLQPADRPPGTLRNVVDVWRE